MTWLPWKTEADLVADFVNYVGLFGAGHRNWPGEPWTVYAETAGWDLLLVRQADGFQIGVEAKLALNAKVLCQVLEHDRWRAEEGPDCHAVLVPCPKSVNGLQTIARRLGIVVIEGSAPSQYAWPPGPRFAPELPKLKDPIYEYREDWPQRCPDRRCTLPDYIPDVAGGKPAPVQLTHWKIAALKIQVLLEERGYVTRADFAALKLSPSRWTQFWLRSNGEGGWVPRPQMPDFKAQHPINYEQIKADKEKWMAALPASVLQPRLPGAAE